MESELLSLKWNNHRTTFLHVIGTLRSKASYTDATLACDGKFYPVHKLVLSTCSEYFGAIFERTPCKSPVIVLKDIECKNLEFLLDYMYIGEVNVRQNELAALIKAAECLKIKGLAVPDEEPSANTFPKNIRSDSQRESSPPAKRRRNVQSGSELEGKRESSETSNNTGLEKGPSKDLGECPLDDGISPIKLEPLDDAEVSNFITNSNSTGVNNEKISDEGGGGGCESSKEDSTTDIKEFFNAKVESEESVHMGEYSSSEFAGPSGVQNSNLSQWDSENSFPMDHLLAGSSSTQLETQQQQQQLLRQWLDQLALVTGWNKLKCPICGKICSRSDKLKLHLRIHTGERPYCCTYCHHRSRTSDDLKRHIRTHTGERPYPCPFCPYRASDPSTIRSHKKHRHGDQMNAAAANASLTGASAATSSSSSPSTVPIAAIPSPLSERERKYVSSPVASLMADFASDSEDKDENASVRAVPKHTRKNLI